MPGLIRKGIPASKKAAHFSGPMPRAVQTAINRAAATLMIKLVNIWLNAIATLNSFPFSPIMPIGERRAAILSDRSGLILPPT